VPHRPWLRREEDSVSHPAKAHAPLGVLAIHEEALVKPARVEIERAPKEEEDARQPIYLDLVVVVPVAVQQQLGATAFRH